MKKWILLTLTCVTLSGCTLVKQDLRYPGGAVGSIVDDHTPYKANGSKQMIVYRAIVGLMLMSKVAQATVVDGQEADAIVEYMSAVSKDINNLAGHLETSACDGEKVALAVTCTDYPMLFESDLPPLEGHMIRLGVAALPRKEGAKFLKSFTSQNPLDILSSAWRLGGKVVIAGHNAAASYRSEREILAVLTMPTGETPPANIEKALEQLAEPGRGSVALKPENVEPLYKLIRDVCLRMPLNISTDTTSDAATVQDTRRKKCKAISYTPTKDRYPML
ncbi:hypothetical protein GTZ99_01590 [Novosphingobium sp. FSY-8]|uniref:Lipoprotein n=1 Tax=Novosphingobium ovatum TaxID=1908523 RepID=A0ABW9X9N7_9SPHN|nr:hypothetical protein [Novosphingobium ovatum]NBC35247.1 hypothetical protein [Novosphingobium ovatum]